MSASVKKIWNIFTSIIVTLVVALALLLVGPRVVGIRTFTVLSGSMEPTYHTGSIIYVKKVPDATKIADGTVITFMLDEDTIATHRVVTAVPDEDEPGVVRYRTKGDANEHEDGTLVHYKNVIGTPVFTIPKLGYVASYIQQPPGLYLSISLGAMLILCMFLPELIDVLKEDGSKGKEPKPAKEPKPKREKTPKAPKAPKAPETPKADKTSKINWEMLAKPEKLLPTEESEAEPMRRGSHELKEASKSAAHKPAKRKGGAHVIEKTRKK